jgi:ribosomal protein L37AE/L43A
MIEPVANKKVFVTCPKCGKRLIGRMESGAWEFMFGRGKDKETSFVPVHMFIHGPIKMKCISRECRAKYPSHWNLLAYFPGADVFLHTQEECSAHPKE